jgi:hypothetical protein
VQQNAHLPEELKRAYFNAEFVNMQSGSVYNYFKREQHVIDETVIYNDNLELYIGCDFNIQHMAAVVAVKDEKNNLLIFDEVVDAYDTFDLIDRLKAKYNLRRCVIFPDASGRNRHTSSDNSNIDLLHNAGFKRVIYDDSGNPRVRDTINLCNTKLNTHSIKITRNCNNLVSALEQQTYDKKGEPDKSQGIDHVIDSFRYLTHGVYNGTGTIKHGYRNY